MKPHHHSSEEDLCSAYVPRLPPSPPPLPLSRLAVTLRSRTQSSATLIATSMEPASAAGPPSSAAPDRLDRPDRPDHLDRAGVSGRADLSGLYHLGRTLGRGHFAVVKLARHVSTGQLVAIKMIDKTKLDIMATSHLLQEAIDTPTTLHLVMELAEGGDLYDYILRHEGGVAERAAKRHFAQMARAVAYCHRLHVVHRDLKPENVVFFPRQGAVKLTDFGFSNLFQPGALLATSCGSLAYSAPEILLGEQYHAPAVDIWSLGVILYMLVCGVPPFQETNDSETLVMILDCRYSVPDHVSEGCRDLISKMLQKDPALRATLPEIEAHDWLAGLDDALLSPEAPPHWLSGALSAASIRPGLPECGDLLAARPPPTQQPGTPGTWQPGLGCRRRSPAEEAPVVKTPAALQQICEEEDEEEEEEEEEGEGDDAGSSWAPGPVSLRERSQSPPPPGEEVAGPLDTHSPGEAGREGLREEEEEEREVKEEWEEKAEGDKRETGAFVSGGRGGGRRVISDQPVGNEAAVSGHAPGEPPTAEPRRFMGVQCCQGEPDPVSPPGAKTSAPCSTLPPSASELGLGGRGAKDKKKASAEREDFLRDKLQAHHHASGSEAAAPGRTDPGKGRSVRLKERLFQFPLCEKALAFNIPTHNKSKVLPLAQYNCCHDGHQQGVGATEAALLTQLPHPRGQQQQPAVGDDRDKAQDLKRCVRADLRQVVEEQQHGGQRVDAGEQAEVAELHQQLNVLPEQALHTASRGAPFHQKPTIPSTTKPEGEDRQTLWDKTRQDTKMGLPRNSVTTGTDTRAIRSFLCQAGKSGSTRPVAVVTGAGLGEARGQLRVAPAASVVLRRFHISMTTVDHSMLKTAWIIESSSSAALPSSLTATVEPEMESSASLFTPPAGQSGLNQLVPRVPGVTQSLELVLVVQGEHAPHHARLLQLLPCGTHSVNVSVVSVATTVMIQSLVSCWIPALSWTSTRGSTGPDAQQGQLPRVHPESTQLDPPEAANPRGGVLVCRASRPPTPASLSAELMLSLYERGTWSSRSSLQGRSHAFIYCSSRS
ncbi:LOW QUALITY PROTEIN: hypothetical protein CRUP_010095 [Coryphaenoides rupestris]|nr:LOW QUALITY PROTEIN: hypothetical protein CRUP_010095 [Coryphaenoides rupestris]